MLRRVLPLLVVVSLGAIPIGAGGCNRSGPGPAFPQPIRDEKEPGESIDTVSAVPDSGSSGVEDMSSSSTEVEIDEGSSADGDDDGEGDKDADKSADTDKSGDEGEGGSGEDETGDDVEIEIEVEP
jgi:hypothetical protein